MIKIKFLLLSDPRLVFIIYHPWISIVWNHMWDTLLLYDTVLLNLLKMGGEYSRFSAHFSRLTLIFEVL